MRRILVQMVVRNEADRYLDCSLDWHRGIFDGIHIFDDRSDDNTVAVALDHGCYVTERPSNVPAFLEHEGKCRQAAWQAMEEKLQPTTADWILALDADEFLVATEDECDRLHAVCEQAERAGAVSVLVRVPEVFDTEESPDGALVKPKIRVDGFWGQIIGTRLFRYRANGRIADKAMSSGSEPTYLIGAPRIQSRGIWLMHYGYADPADRKAKYERYTASPTGHANSHINSIVEDPTLKAWEGPSIDVYRGHRANR